METSHTAEDSALSAHCFPVSGVASNPGRSVLHHVRDLNARSSRACTTIPTYVWCTIFTALGGFCFGFDTGSIGPLIVMPRFQQHFFGDKEMNPTVQGLIVSSILLTASLASLVSGPMSNKISRVRTISLGAVVFAAGSAIACASGPLPQLFVGRCLAGVGEGLFLSAITVYTVEIAPASARGRLGTVVQLLITIGIASGYFVCYGTSHIPSSLSWRFPLGMQAAVSIVLAAGCPFLPHSPRWLHHVGRHGEARAAWERLGVSAADVEKTEQAAQREEVPREGFWKETRQMWKKGIRTRTMLGVFLSGMQQASGIDGVLYYAPVLFSQAGLSSTTSSFIASGVSGLVIMTFTFLCQFFTDTWGRRPSMIRGGAVVAGSMLIIGSLYASGATDHASGRWAVIALIYIFVIGYTCTWAICVRIICSEIQPTRTRAAVSSLGQCANWAVNWLIAFSTPLFLAKSTSGPYFLFGACSLVTTLVCLAFQPETRGASLEEVDEAFAQPPWKALLQKSSHRHGEHRRQPSRENEFELDVIHLPEVAAGFGVSPRTGVTSVQDDDIECAKD
ncbi:MFS sugar transporter [Phanerochaete sordida]|uniref:MFS sugar transporter n=1 Tax=Phanerochaete sordida TaxID=48140 RepID=A0A9P3GQI4_9APHY|nr:MFS sugar transporter [Phanerochaete sordida]